VGLVPGIRAGGYRSEIDGLDSLKQQTEKQKGGINRPFAFLFVAFLPPPIDAG